MSESPNTSSRQHGAEQKLADYAMIFDMLGLLTGITKEMAAINKIMEIFTMLFAPQSLIYISIRDGKTQEIKTHPPSLNLSDDTIKPKFTTQTG